MHYLWSWREKNWIERLHKHPIKDPEYWAEWDKHMGGTDDFCEFFKKVSAIATEHFSPVVADAIRHMLPALEAGETNRIEVGPLWLYAREEE